MRHLMLPLLLLFSVFVAGVHAPALEHQGDLHSLGLHAADDASHDAGGTDESAAPAGSGAVHHHHCPMALTAGDDAPLGTALLSRERLVPGLSVSLSSCASAPLLEPPLA